MEEIGPIELLKTLGDGRVLDDFDQRVSELLMACRMSHKKGKVVLTVTVTPNRDIEVPRVDVHGDGTAKIPHIERGSELFFVNDDNQLSRRHPRQAAPHPNTVHMPPPAAVADVDNKSLAAGEKK